MRVVIDCFKQIKGEGKSIGIYNVALSLVQNLAKEQKHSDNKIIKSYEIVILGNEYNEKDFNIEGTRFISVKNYNPKNKIHCILWELFGVIYVCKKLKADKIIFPRGYCALIHPIGDIVLIHDLIPFYYNEHFPGVFRKLENAYIMNRLKISARSAKQVITISEASKRDIIKYCGVDEEKITVIYNACNAISFSEEKARQEKPYICAVTSDLPHKNAKGILLSYKKYCTITENPLRLVVIGISDTSCCELPEYINSNITCYKFIKDNMEMYRLINNSTVFIFLSLIEGFGLPPIEAMQLRVPVICSDVSSLPEVTGNAAVLVNPYFPDVIAEKLDSLVKNQGMQKELVNRGIENIKRFSWETRSKLYWKEIIK